MELKQLAGDRDLYDVMRRQRRRQKHVDASAANTYKTGKDHSQSSGYVFDIINRKLNSRKTGTSVVVAVVVVVVVGAAAAAATAATVRKTSCSAETR